MGILHFESIRLGLAGTPPWQPVSGVGDRLGSGVFWHAAPRHRPRGPSPCPPGRTGASQQSCPRSETNRLSRSRPAPSEVTRPRSRFGFGFRIRVRVRSSTSEVERPPIALAPPCTASRPGSMANMTLAYAAQVVSPLCAGVNSATGSKRFAVHTLRFPLTAEVAMRRPSWEKVMWLTPVWWAVDRLKRQVRVLHGHKVCAGDSQCQR